MVVSALQRLLAAVPPLGRGRLWWLLCSGVRRTLVEGGGLCGGCIGSAERKALVSLSAVEAEDAVVTILVCGERRDSSSRFCSMQRGLRAEEYCCSQVCSRLGTVCPYLVCGKRRTRWWPLQLCGGRTLWWLCLLCGERRRLVAKYSLWEKKDSGDHVSSVKKELWPRLVAISGGPTMTGLWWLCLFWREENSLMSAL